MKPLRKAFSCVKTKTINSSFAVELAERSNRPFYAYLMNHFFQTSVLLMCDNAYCLNMCKCQTSRRASILVNSYTEFSKTQFFPMRSLSIWQEQLKINLTVFFFNKSYCDVLIVGAKLRHFQLKTQ